MPGAPTSLSIQFQEGKWGPAHTRPSRPGSALGFQVRVPKTFQGVPCWLGSGPGTGSRVHRWRHSLGIGAIRRAGGPDRERIHSQWRRNNKVTSGGTPWISTGVSTICDGHVLCVYTICTGHVLYVYKLKTWHRQPSPSECRGPRLSARPPSAAGGLGLRVECQGFSVQGKCD